VQAAATHAVLDGLVGEAAPQQLVEGEHATLLFGELRYAQIGSSVEFSTVWVEK
jgi:hypothetical protein